jgi:valyl-tRNA synthetase
LQKRKAKAEQELGKARGKLSNPNFVASAPGDIVAEVHERIANFERQVAEAEQQEQAVRALVAQR